MVEAFKTASTRIEARPTGLSKTTGGRTSCYPSPAGFSPPCPRKEVAAERNNAGLPVAFRPVGTV